MRRATGSGGRGNMRNGLISLLTVVVVISMATAAVLTVSTSHAMYALSTRQATMTAEGYAAERSAQALLAAVDEELASAKAQGTSQALAVKRVSERMNGMLAKTCEDGVSATFDVTGNLVACTYTTEGGRMLKIAFTLENATYNVESWRLTAAPQEESTGDVLWTGSTAEE